MINKRIVFVDGTTIDDRNAFVDAAMKYSENVIYHSVVDAARHIAFTASVGYNGKSESKDLELIDDIINAFDKYCNLSMDKFIEAIDGFNLIPELDTMMVYCRFERIHKDFMRHCTYQNIQFDSVFVKSSDSNETNQYPNRTDINDFRCIIERTDDIDDFNDKVIRFICKAPV